MIVVVFNDAALSLVSIRQRPDAHDGPEAVSCAPVSFAAAAAAAMGAAGVTVTTASGLAAAVTSGVRPVARDLDHAGAMGGTA